MKKHLILLLLTAYSAFGQNEKPFREPFTLKLAVDSVQYYQMDVAKTPYMVDKKILQIYPGERLFIETEVASDTLSSMRVVNENKHPERTIIIEFTQQVINNVPQQMFLTVVNPFSKKSLNYNAAMFIVGRNEWLDTSIIPIRPGLTNYEMWPDVIISLVLYGWRFE